MDLLREYQGLRVLVTGGCSFIGSHLAEKLVALGARVSIVDDLSSGVLANIDSIRDVAPFTRGDLRDPAVVADTVQGKDIVFHLANIHGGRGYIETHPAELTQNMIIDGNVFRASVLAGVKRVCYTSSACVYPTNRQVPNSPEFARFLSEEMADPFKQNCALADGEYGWGKFMGEMTLRAYHKQYGLKGVSCRLFTVYGPRENESHAIIAFIAKAVLKQDPYEIWGSGNQDRNFTYVDDIVEGCLRAALKIDDTSAINIGTDEVITVRHAASVVCDLVGHKPRDIFCDVTKPEGVLARAASTAMQEQRLSWRPQTKFQDGIRKTVEWYCRHKNIELLRDQNLEKILFER
jgi:UDP-glucose 4-epimerase